MNKLLSYLLFFLAEERSKDEFDEAMAILHEVKLQAEEIKRGSGLD